MSEELLGKYLLIGLTYVDGNDEVVEQVQTHGKIVAVSKNTVTIFRENSGDEFSIPYDAENLIPAEPGEYCLRGNGEIVIDPDFLSSWTINKNHS
ncbi:MAG: hypothetical protein NXI13_11855 [Proteobacteria bacterium]|nr:hypothetical protein [Pseudomonadota bacterium]